MDLGVAADEIDVAVGVNAVALAVDAELAAHHVKAVVQHTLIQAVAVCGIDSVIG